ncbi:MAG: hypothetical protein ABFR33_03255 [Verrucomicrobiota bacterium]
MQLPVGTACLAARPSYRRRLACPPGWWHAPHFHCINNQLGGAFDVVVVVGEGGGEAWAGGDDGTFRVCVLTNGTRQTTLLFMSRIDWNDEKNEWLGRTRGLCFEDVLVCIQNGGVLDVVRHPDRERYPRQNIIVLNVGGYAWLVPYVKSKGVRFLKTAIPSRKATKEYLT